MDDEPANQEGPPWSTVAVNHHRRRSSLAPAAPSPWWPVRGAVEVATCCATPVRRSRSRRPKARL